MGVASSIATRPARAPCRFAERLRRSQRNGHTSPSMTGTPSTRIRAIVMMVAAMALFAAMDAINKTLTQGYAIPRIMAVRA